MLLQFGIVETNSEATDEVSRDRLHSTVAAPRLGAWSKPSLQRSVFVDPKGTLIDFFVFPTMRALVVSFNSNRHGGMAKTKQTSGTETYKRYQIGRTKHALSKLTNLSCFVSGQCFLPPKMEGGKNDWHSGFLRVCSGIYVPRYMIRAA